MTESAFLSDKCCVKFVSGGLFEILPTTFLIDSPTYRLSDDKDCLVARGIGGDQFALWIWSDYSYDIKSRAFYKNHICFGYRSGRLLIVDLSDCK